ncbi:putative transcription factor & chromatin remodeling ARID family [Helianthus anomalus]
MIGDDHVHNEYKADYLNTYFENLNISSKKLDWNIVIIQEIEFHDFSNCMSLLDMLEDVEFVFKYKYELRIKFKEMVELFLRNNLGITTRPVTPYTKNNRKIDLLDLYMVVKRDGGHKKVSESDTWTVVTKDLGFDYNDGYMMRITNVMYLNVLEYYYKFKTVQKGALARDMMNAAMNMDDESSSSMQPHIQPRSNSLQKNLNELARPTASDYALYMGLECSEATY